MAAECMKPSASKTLAPGLYSCFFCLLLFFNGPLCRIQPTGCLYPNLFKHVLERTVAVRYLYSTSFHTPLRFLCCIISNFQNLCSQTLIALLSSFLFFFLLLSSFWCFRPAAFENMPCGRHFLEVLLCERGPTLYVDMKGSF